jgi:hypothetical protein
VGVEEVRRAVERDGGLAGSRASLNDQRASELGADDLVLLSLDRRDDVVHAAGPSPGERGEERSVAVELPRPSAVERVEIEHLVFDRDERPSLDDQVTAADHTSGRAGGCAVEQRGHRRSPIDQQRILLLASEADTADVEPRSVVEVESTETEWQVADSERVEATFELAGEDVALGP